MFPESLFPIISSLIACALAQFAKTIFYYFKSGKWDLKWVIASGGFPSSHSSTVTALALSIGLQDGFETTTFAIASILAFIVMYDACHVRYYSGKNIELTQQLIKDIEKMTDIELVEPIYQEKLKNVLGHKLREVLGGIVIGIVIPLLMAPLFVG